MGKARTSEVTAYFNSNIKSVWMENKMFTGFWTGYFLETETGGTKIIFKENILIKNSIIKILSYFFMDLKKCKIPIF